MLPPPPQQELKPPTTHMSSNGFGLAKPVGSTGSLCSLRLAGGEVFDGTTSLLHLMDCVTGSPCFRCYLIPVMTKFKYCSLFPEIQVSAVMASFPAITNVWTTRPPQPPSTQSATTNPVQSQPPVLAASQHLFVVHRSITIVSITQGPVFTMARGKSANRLVMGSFHHDFLPESTWNPHLVASSGLWPLVVSASSVCVGSSSTTPTPTLSSHYSQC